MPPSEWVVIVPTYRRPGQLSDCLLRLATSAQVAAQRVSVVVVDNDAADTARAAMEGIRGHPVFEDVWYVRASPKGVVHARNAALRFVRALPRRFRGALWIDDDETPEPGWVAAMTSALSQADVVEGRVRKVWTSPCDLDALEPTTGGVDDRTRPAAPPLATSNLGMSATILYSSLEFDPWFNGIGGEDGDFSFRCRALTHRFLYCGQAVVTEVQPAERTTREYLQRRALFANYGRQAVLHRHGMRGPAAVWACCFRVSLALHAVTGLFRRGGSCGWHVRHSALAGGLLYWSGGRPSGGDY